MLEGRLVRLRAFEQGDLDANHAFVNDADTLRGMLSGIPFPASYADERRWLEQQTSYTRGEYQFAVEDFEGDLVGRCGINRLDWKNRVAELGIMIGTPYRRRGYGREAMELLCDFCFREMNLHKLKVSVFAFNEPAIRCYEGCGFKREGLLKSELWRDGAYRDVVLLAKHAP
ncbi:MAG: GNAT family N-acetyltransferase [Aristaeellaceae bacterium]